MSPFIVTATLPAQFDADGMVTAFRDMPPRAVAGLDEAKTSCILHLAPRIQDAGEFEIYLNAAMRLTEAGGTIPLPDGGRVTVEAATQSRMREDLRVWGAWIDTRDEPDDVIAAVWLRRFAEHNTAYAKALADARGTGRGGSG